MRHVDGLWIDHVDAAISGVALAFEGALQEFSNVLISCIDSQPQLRKIVAHSRDFAQVVESFEYFENGVLVSLATFLKLIRSKRFFTGFDEVWMFRGTPTSSVPLPSSIVGPGSIEEYYSPDLALWMSKTGASLGLADGDGLNVITPDFALCSAIHEKHAAGDST